MWRWARVALYWPNLNDDVYDTVSKCDVCQVYRSAQTQQPLRMHGRPIRPWGCGLFYLRQTACLLVVDYESHCIEIEQLSSESAHQVIVQLKSQLVRHGKPATLISDGGRMSPVLSSRRSRRRGEFTIRDRVPTSLSRTVSRRTE